MTEAFKLERPICRCRYAVRLSYSSTQPEAHTAVLSGVTVRLQGQGVLASNYSGQAGTHKKLTTDSDVSATYYCSAVHEGASWRSRL